MSYDFPGAAGDPFGGFGSSNPTTGPTDSPVTSNGGTSMGSGVSSSSPPSNSGDGGGGTSGGGGASGDGSSTSSSDGMSGGTADTASSDTSSTSSAGQSDSTAAANAQGISGGKTDYSGASETNDTITGTSGNDFGGFGQSIGGDDLSLSNAGTSVQGGDYSTLSDALGIGAGNTGSYPSQGSYGGLSPSWGRDLGAAADTIASGIGQPSTPSWSNDRSQYNDWATDSLSALHTDEGIARSPSEISEEARTVYGEAGNQAAPMRAAVANVMDNRLIGGSSWDAMMNAFDANGYDRARTGPPNDAYVGATPSTAGYTSGVNAMIDAVDPASEFNLTAPPNVKNATHYLTDSLYQSANAPTWSRGTNFNNSATPYGDHVFGTADTTPDKMAALREALIGSPPLAQPAQSIAGPSPIPMPMNMDVPFMSPTTEFPARPSFPSPNNVAPPPNTGDYPSRGTYDSLPSPDMDFEAAFQTLAKAIVGGQRDGLPSLNQDEQALSDWYDSQAGRSVNGWTDPAAVSEMPTDPRVGLPTGGFPAAPPQVSSAQYPSRGNYGINGAPSGWKDLQAAFGTLADSLIGGPVLNDTPQYPQSANAVDNWYNEQLTRMAAGWPAPAQPAAPVSIGGSVAAPPQGAMASPATSAQMAEAAPPMQGPSNEIPQPEPPLAAMRYAMGIPDNTGLFPSRGDYRGMPMAGQAMVGATQTGPNASEIAMNGETPDWAPASPGEQQQVAGVTDAGYFGDMNFHHGVNQTGGRGRTAIAGTSSGYERAPSAATSIAGPYEHVLSVETVPEEAPPQQTADASLDDAQPEAAPDDQEVDTEEQAPDTTEEVGPGVIGNGTPAPYKTAEAPTQAGGIYTGGDTNDRGGSQRDQQEAAAQAAAEAEAQRVADLEAELAYLRAVAAARRSAQQMQLVRKTFA